MRATSPRPSGDKLRYLRTLRGWTQADLAREADVAGGTVNNLEAEEGRMPRPVTLRRVAKAFDVPVEELFEPPPGREEAERNPLDVPSRLFGEEADRLLLVLEGMLESYQPPGEMPLWGTEDLERVRGLLTMATVRIAAGEAEAGNMERVAEILGRAETVQQLLTLRLEALEKSPGEADTFDKTEAQAVAERLQELAEAA
jgi:transcriptional regulator with XRE-family HTH domain